MKQEEKGPNFILKPFNSVLITSRGRYRFSKILSSENFPNFWLLRPQGLNRNSDRSSSKILFETSFIPALSAISTKSVCAFECRNACPFWFTFIAWAKCPSGLLKIYKYWNFKTALIKLNSWDHQSACLESNFYLIKIKCQKNKNVSWQEFFALNLFYFFMLKPVFF